MPPLFFADTTVLVNFAHVERWDLLEALMRQRARWVASGEDECRSWVGTFATIHDESGRLLGEAVRPEAREYQDVRIVRDSMAEPFEPPQKHLGEAESLVIIENRFAGSLFVTDDGGAHRVAAARGVRCLGTLDLFKGAEQTGLLDSDTHLQLVQSLHRAGRVPRSFT